MKRRARVSLPGIDARVAGTPPSDERSPRAGLVALQLAIVLVSIVVGLSASAQSPPADPLSPVRGLIGRWQGTAEGQPGKGTVEREYTAFLGTRFLHVKNRSTYPPQEKNPKGEVHEDVGVFSFDRARKCLVLRQFHTEGFVSQYVLTSSSKTNPLTFVTEAIENIALGWRGRETYTMSGPDEFEETFELAEPGKDFELYSRTRLKRVH